MVIKDFDPKNAVELANPGCVPSSGVSRMGDVSCWLVFSFAAFYFRCSWFRRRA